MSGECLDVDAESFSADMPPKEVVSFGGEWRLLCLIMVVVGAGVTPGNKDDGEGVKTVRCEC